MKEPSYEWNILFIFPIERPTMYILRTDKGNVTVDMYREKYTAKI